MEDVAALQVFPGSSVSDAAASLATAIATSRPTAALLVLELRFDAAGQRWVTTARAYNRNFQNLTDSRPFKSGELSDVFVTNPVFLSQASMKMHTACVQRCFAIGEAILRRQTAYGSLISNHVTHAGRWRKVFKEFIAAQVSPMRAEYLLCETLLPDEFSIAADCSAPHSLRASPLHPEPHFAQQEREYSAAQALHHGANFPFDLRADQGDPGQRKERTSAAKKPEKRFSCAICRTRHTAQRRRGPKGPGTLCNRCGLRWRKERQEREASELGEHVQTEQEDSDGDAEAVGIAEA